MARPANLLPGGHRSERISMVGMPSLGPVHPEPYDEIIDTPTDLWRVSSYNWCATGVVLVPLTNADFRAFLDDASKRIDGDILWMEDEDHSPAVEFRVKIESDQGYPLFLKGSYNGLTKTLSFTIVHTEVGRIYALDLGKDHRNPSGELVGEKHKHRWNERYRDKEAYEPQDITAATNEPLLVWEQFCKEASITHNGKMRPPPSTQQVMFT